MASGAELAMILRAKDESVQATFDKIEGAARGFGSTMSNIATSAAGFVIGNAITQLPGFLMDAAKAAAEDEQATARLSTTIRSLGGDYDAQMASVNGAIAAGQKLAFTDDQVRNSYQFLAQATGSSDEALRRQTIAMDLARGANIPLEQATKLVGKVNAENVETFKKLGISIGEGATEAEAMAAIQAKFAGQSEAYANSTAGQFEQAQIAIDETKEALGAALLPVLAAVGGVLVDMLPTLQEWAGTLGAMVGEAITPVIAAFQDLLDIFLGGDSFDAASEQLDKLFPPAVSDGIMFTVAALGDMFRAVFEGDIPEALFQAQEVFGNFALTNSAAVDEWAAAFVEWIGPMSADMLTDFGDVAKGLMTWLIETAATIIEQLATWAAAFIDWVAPMIPDMLRALGGYAADMVGWLAGTALPMIVAKLAEWGLAFIEWIAPRIPPMLAALGELLAELGAWAVGTALPAIVAKLLEWGLAFAAWIPGASVAMLGAAITIEQGIVAWIASALISIVAGLVAWGDAFTAWVITVALPALPGALAQIASSIMGWISTTAGSLVGSARAIGQAIIDGIVNAITAGVGAIRAAATNAAQAALNAAKGALGIESPSRVFSQEVGLPIVQGLALGIRQNGGMVADAAMAMAEAARQAAMAALRGGNSLGLSAAMNALGGTMGQGLTPTIRQFGPLAGGSIIPGLNNTPSGSIPIGAGTVKVDVHIGQSKLDDMWVETRERVARQGR